MCIRFELALGNDGTDGTVECKKFSPHSAERTHKCVFECWSGDHVGNKATSIFAYG